MKRRLAALLFSVLLIFQLTSPSALAAKTVYFTAINDNILPLSDETMPFWSGGFLYIPCSLFTGDVKKELDIGYIPNTVRQLHILYTAGRSLHFDLTQSYARDTDGNTYYPSAVQKGNVVFVPASLVAEFFGLTYSVINVDQGYLVWLREAGKNSLPESTFADAAAYSMSYRYEQYLRSQETPESPSDQDEPEEVFDGKSIYLCFPASDPKQVATLLDTLDRQGSQAAFFCTPEFLEQQGDLLRRMTATGQAVGILVDGSDSSHSVEEQLELGNQALYAATFGKTRLVYLQNSAGQSAVTAEQNGYRCLRPDLDRSGYALQSTSQAAALLQSISIRQGNISVWLSESTSSAGLRAFLTAAKGAEDRCLALTETAA